MEHSKNSSMREVYSHKSLPQETNKKKKKKLKKSNLTPKANRERREKQNTKLVELKKS